MLIISDIRGVACFVYFYMHKKREREAPLSDYL